MTQAVGGGRNAAREMFEADAASRALGIDLVETGAGTATARMRVTAAMLNGHQMMHGGYLFLLADTAFGCACNSHGPVTVAAGADISFVAPARLHDELTAVASERTRYGRNGIYDVTVYREGPAGQVTVAEFRGRSRTTGAKVEPTDGTAELAGGNGELAGGRGEPR
jgi:acyl-CoA thioesterase